MKKFMRKLAACFCTIALTAAMVPCATAAVIPAVKSDNFDNQSYSPWSSTVESYLYASGDSLTRVEYIPAQEAVLIETYNEKFQVSSTQWIENELPLWGGFYHGQDYNFLIWGQENKDEQNDAEVIRVVKYDKAWNRIGSGSVFGANTTIPFEGGSLRCAERKGILYVRTCHEMYTSSDGLNHQANMTFVIDEQDMNVTSLFCIVSGGAGYVSHSFNQFILADSEDSIVSLDHGDGYPRSFVLYRYQDKAGDSKFTGAADGGAYFCEFDGNVGENYTGAATGGLVETSSGYLVSYHWQPTGTQWDVYLAHIAKDDFEVTISTLTEGLEDVDSTNPILAPIDVDKGYILWNKASWGIIPTKTLCYARYDADGKTSEVNETEAALSDCQPIPYKDGVLWYTTDESIPTFYYLCDSGLTAIPAGGTTETLFSEFSDLQANSWYAGYVEKVLRTGLMRGMDNTHFNPAGNVTLAEVITLAARHNSERDGRTIEDVPGAWYMGAYSYCVERHIIDPSEYPLERMGEIATRYQVVEILRSGMSGYEHYEAINNVDVIPDVERYSQHGYDVYNWYEAGIVVGDNEHYFHGETAITRAEISAILCRMKDPSMRIRI